MSTLSFAQALSYAQGAGFTGQSAYTIVAIAQAESGLNTTALNCNNPGASCDRGILQINNFWHKEVSDQCAYNPQCAFQAAYRISSNGTNFNPWTTYTSGAYKQYIQAGAGAQPTPLANLQQATSSNASSSPCDTPIVGGLICFIQQSALVVGFFLLGLVLIIVGFIILIHPSPSDLVKGAMFAA